MLTRVTEQMFQQAFRSARRIDNFSYAGLRALYEYLYKEEESTYILDVVELCSSYLEYDNPVLALLEIAPWMYEEDLTHEDCISKLSLISIIINHPTGIIVNNL